MEPQDRFITLKFKNLSEITPESQAQCFEALNRILTHLKELSSIELQISVPRKEKKLFWELSQRLKKMKEFVAPEVEYSDSNIKNISFFSSKSQGRDLLDALQLNNAGEVMDNPSSILSYLSEQKDDGLAMVDFHLAEEMDLQPSERKLFTIEVKDNLRFQAFKVMIFQAKSSEGTLFPGLNKALPIIIECWKGDSRNSNPNKVVAFGHQSEAQHEKLIREYIQGLKYRKFVLPRNLHRRSLAQMLNLISDKEPSLRYCEREADLLLVVYQPKDSRKLEDFFKELLTLRVFERVVILSAPISIEYNTPFEDILRFYRISFWGQKNTDCYNRFMHLADRFSVRNLQINFNTASHCQELTLQYACKEPDNPRFRTEIDRMIQRTEEMSIRGIEENIWRLVQPKVKGLKAMLEEKSEFLLRVYWTPYFKLGANDRRTLVVLGDDSEAVKEATEKIQALLAGYSMETFDPGDPSLFLFLKKQVSVIRKELDDKYAEFILEEDKDSFSFHIYGPRIDQEAFHAEIKSYIESKFYEQLNWIEFKDILVYKEFYREISSQLNHETSWINLNENLKIQIDPDKFRPEKSMLVFGCYRKEKREVFQNLEEKIKVLSEKILEKPVAISKKLFLALTEKTEDRTGLEKIEMEKPGMEKTGMEKIEEKTGVEIRFNRLETIPSVHFRGCFELQYPDSPPVSLTLFHGVQPHFPNKTASIFFVDAETGQILGSFSPRITQAAHAQYMSEFNLPGPKKPFYSIRIKGVKKLKNKSIPSMRIFLCPLNNQSNPENFIDFFELYRVSNALPQVLERLNSEEKPTETLNIFYNDTVNSFSDNLVSETLEWISSLAGFPIKVPKMAIYDPSFSRIDAIFSRLRTLETRSVAGKDRDASPVKWSYIDEDLKGNWTDFPSELNSYIEEVFQRYSQNQAKSQFNYLQEGDPLDKPGFLKIQITASIGSIEDLRVYIESLRMNLTLNGFLAEANQKKEFEFVKDLVRDFRDLNKQSFVFYALHPSTARISVSRLRNNTLISVIDLRKSLILHRDSRNAIIKRSHIKRGVMLSLREGSANPRDSTQTVSIREKIEFEGDRVRIFLRGFEERIRLAEFEIERLTARVWKNKEVILPLEWEPFPSESENFLRFELGKSLRSQEIRQKIERTHPKLEIQRIDRIQNKDLYLKYSTQKEELARKRVNECGANPRYLFFGSLEDPRRIFEGREESFDPKEEKSAVLRFFNKVEDAARRGFVCETGQIEVVLAEVLVGKAFAVQKGSRWNEEEKRPPIESNFLRWDAVEEEDSVLIFDKNRVYPEFLIRLIKSV